RQDGDRGGGSVDASLLLGLGHTLNAMAAALVTQAPVNALAVDAEDHFLVAALLAGAEGNVFHLPALVAGIVGVHIVEIAGKQGGLIAAGAGPDFHDDAVKIFALGQEQVFELGVQGILPRFEAGQLLLDQVPHALVGLARQEALRLGNVGSHFFIFLKRLDHASQRPLLLGQLGVALAAA